MAVSSSFRFLFVSLVLFSLFCLSSAAPVTDLPGYDGPALSMDSGYITIDESTGKSIFYWLVESQNSPSEDPLVLWLQGGPGCSGLIGLLREHGPFVPNPQGGLTYNPLSWTRLVNMLYIEAPCGVGFSYSNTSSDYKTNDKIAAQDNYAFIQAFLEQFPQFQGRDFWVAGESYGGVYVPSLSQLIVSNSSSALYEQFKGFMVGNPVIGCSALNYYDVDFKLLYWHGMVSYSNFFQWENNNCAADPESTTCQKIFNNAYNGVGVIQQPLMSKLKSPVFAVQAKLMEASQNLPSLNPDDIFHDFCTGNGTLEFAIQTPANCTVTLDTLTTAYLNRADVQQALHVTRPPPGGKWAPCTGFIQYTPIYNTMLPFYEQVFSLKPGTHVLVYSGDQDILTCPFAESQVCLYQLNQTLVKQWQPWFVNGATVGYVEQFDTFTFATIKGAGHESPQYQPLIAFNMFERFLTKQNLLDESSSVLNLESKRRPSILRPKTIRQGDVLRMFKELSRQGELNQWQDV